MLSIVNRTKHRLPRLPWAAVLSKVLGNNYELSLVICGDTLMRRLNSEQRGKNRPTNILSFPLEKKSGEIFLDWAQIIREAPRFNRSVPKHTIALFIHGLLHLKGYAHGSRMEALERKLISHF